MWTLLSAPQNLFFSAALLLMALFALAEAFSAVLGQSLSEQLESLAPDFDVPDGSVTDTDTAGVAAKLFGWLELGRLPLLVAMSLFLMAFACIGFVGQGFFHSLGIGFLPAWLAAPPAFLAAVPVLKFGNRWLGKIWPRDETYAVSEETFVGRMATITIGEATFDRPAEAKLSDQYGRTHYIMAASDNKEDAFPQGEAVLIVGRRGSAFTVIRNNNPNLG
jgi:hypothetical protein